jgi:hypothetical protein
VSDTNNEWEEHNFMLKKRNTTNRELAAIAARLHGFGGDGSGSGPGFGSGCGSGSGSGSGASSCENGSAGEEDLGAEEEALMEEQLDANSSEEAEGGAPANNQSTSSGPGSGTGSGSGSGSASCPDNSRNTAYGCKGDAHIGEASHPGPDTNTSEAPRSGSQQWMDETQWQHHMMQSHQDMIQQQRDVDGIAQTSEPDVYRLQAVSMNETTAQFNSGIPPYTPNESLSSLLSGVGSTTYQLPLDVLLFIKAAGLDHKCSAFIRERFNMNTIHMAHSSDLQEIGLTAGEISRYKQELKVSCQLRRSRYNHRGDAHIGEASHPGPWPFSGSGSGSGTPSAQPSASGTGSNTSKDNKNHTVFGFLAWLVAEGGTGSGSGPGSGLVPHTAAAAEEEAPPEQSSGELVQDLRAKLEYWLADDPDTQQSRLRRVPEKHRGQLHSMVRMVQEQLGADPFTDNEGTEATEEAVVATKLARPGWRGAAPTRSQLNKRFKKQLMGEQLDANSSEEAAEGAPANNQSTGSGSGSGTGSGTFSCPDNSRNTAYGCKGDAHIGEASHPGPHRVQRIFPASETGGSGSGSGSGLVPHTAAAAEEEAPQDPQDSEALRHLDPDIHSYYSGSLEWILRAADLTYLTSRFIENELDSTGVMLQHRVGTNQQAYCLGIREMIEIGMGPPEVAAFIEARHVLAGSSSGIIECASSQFADKEKRLVKLAVELLRATNRLEQANNMEELLVQLEQLTIEQQPVGHTHEGMDVYFSAATVLVSLNMGNNDDGFDSEPGDYFGSLPDLVDDCDGSLSDLTDEEASMEFANPTQVGHTHEGMDDYFSMATILAAEQSAGEAAMETTEEGHTEEGYSGPKLRGRGHCGGSTDEDAEGDDEDHSMDYDSDTPPANITATQPEVACRTCGLVFGGPNQERPICCTSLKAECTACGKKFYPSKDARPDCLERSAKSNLEKHARQKGDEAHMAVAKVLKAEDPHLDNWQQGRVPPGETRDASNWQRQTDQEWRNYIGHYNRHMNMHRADQQKALNNQHSGEALGKCIRRLNQQRQSGSVQFRHQSRTGDLELDDEFYQHWIDAEEEREQFYIDWEEAETERDEARRDQEYRDYCRQRPPNDKDGDKRMYLPKK